MRLIEEVKSACMMVLGLASLPERFDLDNRSGL
jgi:hypothetical protein